MKLLQYFKNRIPSEVKYILLLFILTRVILISIGVISQGLLEPLQIQTDGEQILSPPSGYAWLNIWQVWDSGWFLDIARDWYPSIQISSLENIPHQLIYFSYFPLYPLMIRILGIILPNYFIGGIIISNISLIIACIFLYRLVKLDSDEKTALNSIKFLFLFPTAFVLSGVFSESLFLALIIACFYYAKRGNWQLAGCLGFFMSLTRPTGVFAFLPLIYEYLKTKDFNFRNIKTDICFLMLVPVGLLVFMLYNYFSTGDLLTFAYVQTIHSKGANLVDPFRVLFIFPFTAGFPIQAYFYFYLALVCFLFLNVFCKRIGFSYWLFGNCSILIPLTIIPQNLLGIPRYALVTFPLYILFAKLSKNRHLDQIITISSTLLQGFLMVFWATKNAQMPL